MNEAVKQSHRADAFREAAADLSRGAEERKQGQKGSVGDLTTGRHRAVFTPACAMTASPRIRSATSTPSPQ